MYCISCASRENREVLRAQRRENPPRRLECHWKGTRTSHCLGVLQLLTNLGEGPRLSCEVLFAHGTNELSSTALLFVCVRVRERERISQWQSWIGPAILLYIWPAKTLPSLLGPLKEVVPPLPPTETHGDILGYFFLSVSDLYWSNLQGEGTGWNREFIFILCHLMQRLLHNRESEIERIRPWSHSAHELGYNMFIHCKATEVTVVTIIYLWQSKLAELSNLEFPSLLENAGEDLCETSSTTTTFWRWAHRGPERSGDLPRVTQQFRAISRVRKWVVLDTVLGSF